MSTAIARDGEALPPPVPAPPGTPCLPPEVYENRAAIIVALRAQGMSTKEIAEVVKVKPETVRSWLRRARAEGKLSDSIDAALDKDTVFRALEVLHERLEDGNLDAAVAVMKGRGVFRNFTNTQGGATGPVTAIQIVYTTPSGAPPPMLTDIATLPGQIVGTPRVDKAAP